MILNTLLPCLAAIAGKVLFLVARVCYHCSVVFPLNTNKEHRVLTLCCLTDFSSVCAERGGFRSHPLLTSELLETAIQIVSF